MTSTLKSALLLLGLIAFIALISLNPKTIHQSEPSHTLRDNRIMPRNTLRKLRKEKIRY